VSSSVAVVIPAAPRSPYLSDAIEAVLQQDVGAVYVVSEQPPASLSWEGSSSSGGWIEIDAELGFGTGANAGIAAARAEGFERVLLLNDDTRILDSCVRALSSALDGEGVAVAGAVLLEWHEDLVQLSGIAVHEPSARIRVLRDDPGTRCEPRDAVSGAAMLLDLATWEQLGGFCEDFTFYFEDIDYCRRARQAGAEVVICGTARVRHIGGGTRSHGSNEAAWHAARSQVLFARRLGGNALVMSGRTLSAAALGLGWSLRKMGPAGLGASARGAIAGLLWSPRP
jgi:GT2 family glycosyltransferase